MMTVALDVGGVYVSLTVSVCAASVVIGAMSVDE